MHHDLRRGRYSSEQLVAACLARIERDNPTLNAVVALNKRALEQARAADRARASGRSGALLGLPFLVKDCIDVVGLPTTAGVPSRVRAVAQRDATAVARIRAAGAILLGKSNLPPYAGDWQSDNRLFGRSHNPWDPARTPGGSTGGGAAAVAAGFAPLELGTDLAGSIRLPAAFTGIYGHRPSVRLVPTRGVFGGDDSGLTVLGPLARSAADLELALDVLMGGDAFPLPPPRHAQLSDFRVTWVEPPAWLPTEGALMAALHHLLDQLRTESVRVEPLPTEAWGALQPMMTLFQQLVASISASTMDEQQRARAARATRAVGGWQREAAAQGYEASAAQVAQWQLQRIVHRAHIQAHLATSDLILAPTTLGAAYPHRGGPMLERTLEVNGEQVDYSLQMLWPGLATVPGLPATAIPVGQDSDGMPLGLQVIGPHREDRTPLAFARLLSEVVGGYVPPPDYRHVDG